MPGHGVMGIMKLVAVLVAAMVIGNWFLSELRRAQAARLAWYKPYCSIPGLLIIAAILLPVMLSSLGIL
jgi:hypothetical protein